MKCACCHNVVKKSRRYTVGYEHGDVYACGTCKSFYYIEDGDNTQREYIREPNSCSKCGGLLKWTESVGMLVLGRKKERFVGSIFKCLGCGAVFHVSDGLLLDGRP